MESTDHHLKSKQIAIPDNDYPQLSFAENIGILKQEYQIHTGNSLQLTAQMQQEAKLFLVDNYTETDS